MGRLWVKNSRKPYNLLPIVDSPPMYFSGFMAAYREMKIY